MLKPSAGPEPLTRMVFPDGHRGWLATGYGTVRAILADPRFSARAELTHSALAALGPLPPAPPGVFLNLDAPEHTRYRTLLTGAFTVRRMRLLAGHAGEISAECLDAMEHAGGPADLMTSFAHPVPALLTCELLGVPEADRHLFQRLVADLVTTLNDPDVPFDQGFAALEAAQEYLRDLVDAKRVAPTDDLLGELTRTDLSGAELTGVAVLLLIGGFETTANALALGTATLLRHPEHRATLRTNPDRTVEELLRHLAIIHTLTRAARTDVELDGHTIETGATVALSLHTANRDPDRFTDPHRFDPLRTPGPHLSFGYGIHRCLGRQLARVQLRTALPALFSRFPTLRLTIPPDQIPLRPDTLGVHRVRRLPVTW
ncbi:cytochrome P450 [Nocardia sp. NPDC050712]|uniref:cytochrome P450 n=1 Tax=Nocardia sp. NPDC050712 TaxID=3155518 RepID=UPI0033F314A1